MKRNQQSLELPKTQPDDRRSTSIYDDEDEASISPSIEDKVTRVASKLASES